LNLSIIRPSTSSQYIYFPKLPQCFYGLHQPFDKHLNHFYNPGQPNLTKSRALLTVPETDTIDLP